MVAIRGRESKRKNLILTNNERVKEMRGLSEKVVIIAGGLGDLGFA